IAVGAYFHLFGGASDLFLLYDRARGTFNDPNVLGAFLVMPALLLLQRLLIARHVVRSGLMLAAMLAALFLSFSRGAWGQFALAATLLTALTFIASSSNRERVRIVLLALAGMVVIMLLLGVLLSFSQVADIFKERAALEQSYDAGQYGRFGCFLFGADVALEHPFISPRTRITASSTLSSREDGLPASVILPFRSSPLPQARGFSLSAHHGSRSTTCSMPPTLPP